MVSSVLEGLGNGQDGGLIAQVADKGDAVGQVGIGSEPDRHYQGGVTGKVGNGHLIIYKGRHYNYIVVFHKGVHLFN